MSTATTTETAKRTLTLTGRRPVTIVEAEWPVIAKGADSWHDNQYEFQANRKEKASIRVRQHADGRAIVTAAYDYDSNWQGEANREYRGGELVDAGADLASVIGRVGRLMVESAGDTRVDLHMVIRDCIAALPAEEL